MHEVYVLKYIHFIKNGHWSAYIIKDIQCVAKGKMIGNMLYKKNDNGKRVSNDMLLRYI